MPVVRELFGLRVTGPSQKHRKACRTAHCPHSMALCDGGGNRDMVRWRAHDQPLAPLFGSEVGAAAGGFIPCGVCSVQIGETPWAVCPRRLLSFESNQASEAQKPLRERVLSLAGFETGDDINVWSEIVLADTATNTDYRLDYVLRHGADPPVIVEVMTASTSGGNKAKRTDMQSAFCDAVLYVHGLLPENSQSPGVNARQVWARMASQLIVKSQIANAWGGCTIWVVQNSLVAYIDDKTGLRLEELKSNNWKRGEVNLVSANLDDPNDLAFYSGPVRSSDGTACWTDLLGAPAIPPLGVLTQRLEQKSMAASFVV